MSQTTEEQATSPTPEEVIGKVNESISALQDAQQTVVKGAQLLAQHVNDPNAHGAAIPEVVGQHIPVPVMEGTMLQWQKPDGTPFGNAVDLKGEPGRDGVDGQNGTDGQDGQIGPRPDHRWEGTKLLIQNVDGSWPDEGVDLKGDKGDTGQMEGLSDAVDSDSSTTPASSKAVKTAYDKAAAAQSAADAADSKAQAAQRAAEAADNKAQNAQSTAQNADSKAQAAQTAAEAADSKAQSAQSAAEAAQAAADSAAATAADAKAAAESAGELATEDSPGLVKASTTAQAGAVPMAGANGKIGSDWLNTPPVTLFNTRIVITESSAAWTPPVTGWARVTVIGGGGAGTSWLAGSGNRLAWGTPGGDTKFGDITARGGATSRALPNSATIAGRYRVGGGCAGEVLTSYILLDQNTPITVTVGAGGIAGAGTSTSGYTGNPGSDTVNDSVGSSQQAWGGNGGRTGLGYGGGGGACGLTWGAESAGCNPHSPGYGHDGGENAIDAPANPQMGGDGGQGAVIIEYYDPDKEDA